MLQHAKWRPSKDGRGTQYAALPYRVSGGVLEILLITSRRTRRWIVPKGWPVEGLEPAQCAAMEALEEAGVTGDVDRTAVGHYRYLKHHKSRRERTVQGRGLRLEGPPAAQVVERRRGAREALVHARGGGRSGRRAASALADPGIRRTVPGQVAHLCDRTPRAVGNKQAACIITCGRVFAPYR